MDMIGSLLGLGGGNSVLSGRLLGPSPEQLFRDYKSKLEKNLNTKIFMLYQGKETSWMSSFTGSETISWTQAKDFIDFLRDEVERSPAPAPAPEDHIAEIFDNTSEKKKEESEDEDEKEEKVLEIPQKYEGRIDIILHCNGGDAYATEILVHLLLDYTAGPIHVWIPYKAMSAGTLIAMAVDKIHLESKAHMGPIDPQYSWGIAANDVLAVDLKNSASSVGDAMLFVQKGAEKVVNDWNVMIDSIASYHGWSEEQKRTVRERLMFRGSSHGKPIFLPEMREILQHVENAEEGKETWPLMLELSKNYMNCNEKKSY